MADNRDRHARNYSPARSHVARQLERAALGHEVGLNGYTTVEQARVLAGHLQLDRNKTTEEDVTDGFRATSEALLGARTELESELRAEEEDDGFEENRTNRIKMQTGISEGLLLRSLIVVAKE